MKGESKDKYALVTAFPHELQRDACESLDVLQESHLGYSDCEAFRLSGDVLSIPYRIYYDEPDHSQLSSLTCEQRVILYALYTRHHNGYVRESHVTTLLTYAHEHLWVTPYLMLPIGEYVKEIVEVIYHNRFSLNGDFIRTFFREKPRLYRTVQSRVASYWNCYYRRQYPEKQHYVGFQLLEYLNSLLQ